MRATDRDETKQRQSPPGRLELRHQPGKQLGHEDETGRPGPDRGIDDLAGSGIEQPGHAEAGERPDMITATSEQRRVQTGDILQ